MFVKIGNWQFDPGECVLKSVSRSSQFTPQFDEFLITERHQYEGELIPPNGLDQGGAFDWLKTRMHDIETVVSLVSLVDGVGLVDSRGIETQNYLRVGAGTAGTVLNIRVSQPVSYGFRDQTEGLTGRTFSFAIEADLKPFTSTAIHSYSETYTWQGDCGPEFVAIELDSGEADIQQVREKTIQTITQQGRAVGIGTYPDAPATLYPWLPRATKPVVSQQQRIRRGNALLLYPITWRYVMLSTINQFGG